VNSLFVFRVLFLFFCGCSTASAEIRLTLEQVSVLNSVNYTPNLPEGGFADPQKKQRYSQQKITLSNKFDNDYSLIAWFSSYQLVSLRDLASVNQIEFGIRKEFERKHGGGYYFSTGIKHSYASRFEKNSFTTTDEGIVTTANIHDPADITLSLAAGFNQRLFSNTAFYSDFTVGYQQTKFTQLEGRGVSNSGCKFQFLSQNNGGQITQTEPCGLVNTYKQTFPNDDLLNDRLGVSPSADIQYSGWYLGNDFRLSQSINPRILVSASYGFRFFSRNDIDEDSDNAFHVPVNFSHNILVEIQGKITPNLSLAVQGNYQIAPFLESVPFLYTRYTSNRYDRSAPSFSLSASYRF